MKITSRRRCTECIDKPRVSREFLARHRRADRLQDVWRTGLRRTDGRAFRKAKAAAGEYSEISARTFLLEIQDKGCPTEHRIHKICQVGADLGIPMVRPMTATTFVR